MQSLSQHAERAGEVVSIFNSHCFLLDFFQALNQQKKYEALYIVFSEILPQLSLAKECQYSFTGARAARVCQLMI